MQFGKGESEYKETGQLREGFLYLGHPTGHGGLGGPVRFQKKMKEDKKGEQNQVEGSRRV